MNFTLDPGWAAALSDPAVFEHDEERLGHVWTLLGLTTDLEEDGRWFRSRLGCSSAVFVQRFGESIRGFENRCPHRLMPLRTEERGRGPVRCGFHHWQFNADGQATGIPKCAEMFGCTPREMGQSLRPVEIGVCGKLVFGRFVDEGASASDSSHVSLETFLADAFPILEAMTGTPKAPRRMDVDISASWRFGIHIGLDDYHIAAVHPDTFGKDGYLRPEVVHYHRIGVHSAYFYGPGTNDPRQMAEACRAGAYRSGGYRMFHIVPNLFVILVEIVGTWYVVIQQYQPRSMDRTRLRTWYARAPFAPADRSPKRRLQTAFLSPWMPWIARYGIRKIVKEDNRICETLQTAASQIDASPVLGRHEERIAWFEAWYREVTTDEDRAIGDDRLTLPISRSLRNPLNA